MTKVLDRGLENREVVLDILTEVLERGGSTHLVLNRILQKYQYPDKPDHAFITWVTEGTLEHLLWIDHIISGYSKTKTEKMKPLIRNLSRMSAYRTLYMNRAPDSAAYNRMAKLAVKRYFSGLKGFVSDAFRTVSREKDSLMSDTPSLAYGIPQWMYDVWGKEYGREKTGAVAVSFFRDRPTWMYYNLGGASRKKILESLTLQGVTVIGLSQLESMVFMSGCDCLESLESLRGGWIQVQDIIPALVSELADPKEGDCVTDVCAAPGGKSLRLTDKLKGTDMVEARGLSEWGVAMIEGSMAHFGASNMKVVVWDAPVADEGVRGKVNIVIMDPPCSDLGIVGKKPDIKYDMTMEEMAELASLQREILAASWEYVKPGGTLVYSACTIDTKESEGNVRWLLSRFPLEPVDLTNQVGNAFDEPSLRRGMIQFLPGIRLFDGFFINVFRRKQRIRSMLCWI